MTPVERVFDIHQHVGLLSVSDRVEGGETSLDIDKDYRRRIEIMDRFGVSKGAIMPALQYERPNGQADTRRINELMAEYKRRYADRFPIAIGTVEPLHGEELGLAELERMKHELHLDGVVWHHRFQGVFMADRRMRPFLRKAEELGMPAFVHLFAESTMEAPWGLEVLADAFPGVTFIAIDAFSGYTQTRYMLSLGKRYRNVLFETAALFPLGRLIEEFVEQLGSERIVYGSDLYLDPLMYNVPHVLEEIRAAAITPQDRENILWNNACRLFNRPL